MGLHLFDCTSSNLIYSKIYYPEQRYSFKLLLQATMLLVELSYTLATEEAERIGVDHVARVSTSDTGESSTGSAINFLDSSQYFISLLCKIYARDLPICHWTFFVLQHESKDSTIYVHVF